MSSYQKASYTENRMKRQEQQGFSLFIVLAAVLVLGVAFFGFRYIQGHNEPQDKAVDSSATPKQKFQSEHTQQTDETAGWIRVTTQAKGFSMKVPDGWKLTSYPEDFLGSMDVVYQSGARARVDTSGSSYSGHSLRFRAAITALDDAGLGPQWSSPQPSLEESVEDFFVGSLQGKRFKGTFSHDLDQTLYEYVFGLSGDKKLDIVYTVNHTQNEKDDVGIVEKAIKSIQLNN